MRPGLTRCRWGNSSSRDFKKIVQCQNADPLPSLSIKFADRKIDEFRGKLRPWGKTPVPPVFPRSQSPPPPTVWDRFAPAVRARRPPCHVPGAMRSGRERRLRPWGCAFQTSLASATSWAVASIAALRPYRQKGVDRGGETSRSPRNRRFQELVGVSPKGSCGNFCCCGVCNKWRVWPSTN